jgi:regulator of RNase E activity RraA
VAHVLSQAARPGDVVVLDGSGSSGAGGAVLSYKWTVADPTGEAVALAAGDTARPSFRPPRVGVYPVALVVNGFVKDVLQTLPMEFAMEAQALVAISLEGSVG